ncbi:MULTISPECIES: GNAT family N-acetyltransferase [unclassified Pseudomonas]|uniref:GNAT family N-acetyltransferase n=1 Tax=unclassified Pseudomonas TaxID=196821 RepID=UPI0025E2C869|nr:MULTISPECIES: GNAT family N-acetyltransferase [unclassified Pseudomonas]
MSTSDPLPFSLRGATTDDALRIAVLGMQVFLDTYATEGIREVLAREVLESFSPDAISRLISRGNTWLIVAESKRHLVGFAQLSTQADHPMLLDPEAAELQRLYVQERFTGCGIGWRLLALAEQQARAQRASMLWATVWVGNQRALAFYPKQGYAHLGSPAYALQNEVHQNALFGKQL